MAVTVKDIAAELGLSYSTVAYALSGKGTIKEKTRQKVMDAAREMGYVPNLYAKSFRGKRTPLIGIVVPNLIMGYNEVVQKIFAQSAETGWDVQTAVSGFCPENEGRQIQRFLEMQADIIFLRSHFQTWDEVPEDHPIRLAENTGSEIIVWGTALRGSPFKAILPDINEQAYKLLSYIKECGYNRITYAVNVPCPLPLTNIEFIDCLRENCRKIWGTDSVLRILTEEDIHEGLHEDEEIHQSHSFYEEYNVSEIRNLQAGRLFFEKFQELKTEDETLILQNDVCANGAIHEAMLQGLKVGEDVSIASLTCNIAAVLSPVPLTACDFLPENFARMANAFCRDADCSVIDKSQSRTVGATLKNGMTVSRCMQIAR